MSFLVIRVAEAFQPYRSCQGLLGLFSQFWIYHQQVAKDLKRCLKFETQHKRETLVKNEKDAVYSLHLGQLMDQFLEAIASLGVTFSLTDSLTHSLTDSLTKVKIFTLSKQNLPDFHILLP